MFWRWERSFHCWGCNNQIEAENSSHQALKRAREQLSYRIRYDKSKTIRTEFETEMDKKFSNFSLKKPFSSTSKKNSRFNVAGVVVQFAGRCLRPCFPVVVWVPACSDITLGETLVVLGESAPGLHTGRCTTVPLGAVSWCCQRHHSAIAVAPLQLGTDKPCATNICWNNQQLFSLSQQWIPKLMYGEPSKN